AEEAGLVEALPLTLDFLGEVHRLLAAPTLVSSSKRHPVETRAETANHQAPVTKLQSNHKGQSPSSNRQAPIAKLQSQSTRIRPCAEYQGQFNALLRGVSCNSSSSPEEGAVLMSSFTQRLHFSTVFMCSQLPQR
ncbi:hypothetical protein ANANG_G00243310, partial [Anguilla anguilla]